LVLRPAGPAGEGASKEELDPMDQRVENATIHAFPHAFINKKGEAILIRTLDDALCQGLIEMYLAYRPRNSFQGLPPISDDACVKWVQHMIGNGINLVALSFGNGVVGHVALFPIDDKRCEMLVVVNPPFQNTGIGTELARCSIRLAHEIGFENMWLSVPATNVRARHVYRKCGFEYLSDKPSRELEMALDLKRGREAVAARVAAIMNDDVITISVDEPCRKAITTFLHHPVATLPVVDENQQLAGIVSESDLMLPSNIDRQVTDVLTREVVTVSRDCPMAKVIRLFQSRRIRCIPVVDEERHLVGIVGRKDVLRYFAENF
jgi:CBS domain-containing protein/RimJ/RimL family protein N-acetyltransferase